MLSLRPLSDDLQKIANEDPSKIQESVAEIKEWLSKQQHIKSKTDDQFLVNFLRLNKFDLEKTKEQLDRYWTLRTIFPKYYSNRDIEDPKLKALLKMGVIIPLPVVSEKAPRYVISRYGLLDFNEHSIIDLMKLYDMISEYLFAESDHSVILGHIVINRSKGPSIYYMVTDLSGFSYKNILHMTPSVIRQLSTLTDATVINKKEIHIVLAPNGVYHIFKLFSAFLGESYSRKVFFHGNEKKIESIIPREILPKEYGGDGASIEEICDHWHNLLASKKDHFAEDLQYGTVESLRPKTQSMFGRFIANFTKVFYSHKRQD